MPSTNNLTNPKKLFLKFGSPEVKSNFRTEKNDLSLTSNFLKKIDRGHILPFQNILIRTAVLLPSAKIMGTEIVTNEYRKIHRTILNNLNGIF